MLIARTQREDEERPNVGNRVTLNMTWIGLADEIYKSEEQHSQPPPLPVPFDDDATHKAATPLTSFFFRFPDFFFVIFGCGGLTCARLPAANTVNSPSLFFEKREAAKKKKTRRQSKLFEIRLGPFLRQRQGGQAGTIASQSIFFPSFSFTVRHRETFLLFSIIQ